MNEKATIEYVGTATGPTPEDIAAAPWITGGYWLIIVAFIVYLVSALVFAFKFRLPGSRLALGGLTVMSLYFVFQNTVANDAELRYGPMGLAVALVAYGTGAVLIAVGYARLSYYVLRSKHER